MQFGGCCLDVDIRIEQCRVVADVLHVLARFVLVLQMQHLQGNPHIQGGSAMY
jgi:hypothetical protein